MNNFNYKKKLIKCKVSVLSCVLAASLSVSFAAAPGRDDNRKVFNSFCAASSQALKNEITSILEKVKESYLPENIDFSDFPYSDGSVESKVNIARYIREKISYIPNVFKYDYVVGRYFNDEDEFNVFYAVDYLEGGTYEGAFANTTNVFNRVISRYKSNMIKNKNHIEEASLYDHITASGQYSPYGSGDYLNYIGFRDEETFQAVLDSLFVMDVIPERMHDFLDFRATKYADDCVRIGGELV